MMRRGAGCFRRTAVLLCAGTAGEAKTPTFKQSPWEILGVDRMSTQEEIKTEYQKLISKHHPDLGGNAEDFQKIHEAYQKVLAGAPAYMMHAKPTKEELYMNSFKEKVEKFLTSRGYRIYWEKMGDQYDSERTRGGFGLLLRRGLIIGSAYWFCWLCDPIKPHWFLTLIVCYWLDFTLGWITLIPAFWFFLWYSMKCRLVPDLFTAAGSYWAFDRPNALTMAYGIPNYASRDQVAYQAPKSRQSYLNLMPEHKGERPAPAAKSPMRRSVGDKQTLPVDVE